MAETEEVTTVSQEVQATPTKVVRKTKRLLEPPIKTEPPQERYEIKKTLFRTYQIIWYILSVIEVLLAFRIILKALGANELSGFTRLVYLLSDPLALPFAGIFPTIGEGSQVFELSSFMACIVYLILAYGIVQLLQMIKPTTPREVEENT